MVIDSIKVSNPKEPALAKADTRGVVVAAADEENWPGVDSRFRLIVVAALRAKQLLRGALPRIEADPRKRRNTSIALEEVKRGLVPFTINGED